MNELKEKLAALGIDNTQIDSIIETVMGFLKDKLPDGASGLLDSALNGDSSDKVQDLLGKVKGFFGS